MPIFHKQSRSSRVSRTLVESMQEVCQCGVRRNMGLSGGSVGLGPWSPWETSSFGVIDYLSFPPQWDYPALPNDGYILKG
jgi:hypothetical protein